MLYQGLLQPKILKLLPILTGLFYLQFTKIPGNLSLSWPILGAGARIFFSVPAEGWGAVSGL